jgi:uncharacterized repeat protein (TIGR03803 family)
MKFKILTLLTAMTVLAALVVPVRLAAQDNQNSNQAQAQTYTVLHTFTGIPDDGASISVAPLLDVHGTLYGTTGLGGPYGGGPFGGVYGSGTAFKLDRNGKETVLYSFTGGADGSVPASNLVPDDEGNLYSITNFGGLPCAIATLYGVNGCGVVFKLNWQGKETVLYSFSGGTDGGIPDSVTMGVDGNLYGVTAFGGDVSCSGGFWAGYGCGVVFKLDRSGNETVLYSFSGVPDGAVPFSFLTMDESGNIYGAAQYGGSLPNPAVCSGNGCGTVFRLDRSGKLTVLHTFTGGADGFQPNGPVLLDDKGNLYGNTEYGGDLTCNCGVVFKLDWRGKLTVLHTFTGGADGAVPNSGMTWGLDGNLYGTTYFGGAANVGTVFEVTTKGKEKVLHSFADLADGVYPAAVLITDKEGNLYGGTQGGGDLSCKSPFGSGCGVVFKFKPKCGEQDWAESPAGPDR